MNQRLLRTEVIIDGSQVDPSLAGDQPQRSFGEAFFREQLFRSIENAFNGFRLSHELSPDKHLFETHTFHPTELSSRMSRLLAGWSQLTTSRDADYSAWVTSRTTGICKMGVAKSRLLYIIPATV
ncbi:hypothetical protein OMD46_17985 [Pseudomonas sp. MDMC_285]|nr:hypothetical protein [Pseudomonas sp. MDMC_285]